MGENATRQMKKNEYEKLTDRQKAVFKVLFTGGVHTAKHIRNAVGDESLNVSAIVKALKEKDARIKIGWRYQKGKGYFKVYSHAAPGRWLSE